MDKFMTASPIVVAIIAGIIMYAIGIFFMKKKLAYDSMKFTRKQLKNLERKITVEDFVNEDNLMRDRYQSTGILSKIFYALPLGKFSHLYLLRAGLASSVDKVFLISLGVFVATLILLPLSGMSNNFIIMLITAIGAAYFVAWQIIAGGIKSRMRKFTEQFPDSLDMIVRSVKSGFPINAAVNMVAESMPAPSSEEFKQISTEVMHGSTLVDAMTRLGERMQTPDIKFFVIVLTLQQEIGGNLAEVLSNLSLLIRKRKMMFKKIRAISAEGRITAWILGSLPLLVALAINFIQPDYLLPLFNTPVGHQWLIAIVITILMGVWIIRKMVDLEV